MITNSTLKISAESLQDEMSRGWDHNSAVRRLTERHEKENAALAEASPEGSAEVFEADAAATAAQSRAESIRAARQNSVSSIQLEIQRLGKMKERADFIRLLIPSPEQTERQAEMTLDAWLLNKDQGTAASAGTVEALIKNLVESEAIKKHVPAYLKKLNDQVGALTSQITATAKRDRLSLPKVLSAMRDSATATPDGTRRNPILFSHFERGYFASLE
jgi:hypothetical protein